MTTPAAVTARPATPADLPDCVRLAGVMYASVQGVEPSAAWAEAALAAVRERLGHDLMLFVADDPDRPGRVVAGAAGVVDRHLPGPAMIDGRAGYVQWVCTDPAHRGRGLGRAVVQAVLDWFDAQGVRKVELHASAAGEALYRSMGFTDPTHAALRRTHGAR